MVKKKLSPGESEFTMGEMQKIFDRCQTASLAEVIDTGVKAGFDIKTLEYHAKAVAEERSMPPLTRAGGILQPIKNWYKQHPIIGTLIVAGLLKSGYSVLPTATTLVTVREEKGAVTNLTFYQRDYEQKASVYSIAVENEQGHPITLKVKSDRTSYNCGTGVGTFDHSEVKDLEEAIKPGMKIEIPDSKDVVQYLPPNDVNIPQ